MMMMMIMIMIMMILFVVKLEVIKRLQFSYSINFVVQVLCYWTWRNLICQV